MLTDGSSTGAALGAVLVVASTALACSESGTVVDSSQGADAGSGVAAPPAHVVVPYLSDLEVSSSADPDGSTSTELVPAFSPHVFDYYVRCAARTNPLTISMTAAAGSSSQLILPARSPSRRTQTLSLDVDENQALVAVATQGTARTEYWVRCLPYDFPVLQMTAHPEVGTPPAGYYLVGNLNAKIGETGYAIILDQNGVPVWYVRAPSGDGVCDVENLVGSAISFVPTAAPSSVDAPFELHQLSLLSKSYLAPTGIPDDIHELRVLSNGHYLVFTNFVKTGVDLTGLALPLSNGDLMQLGPNSSIAESEIVEFDPTTGAVAWQWFASDHFDPAKDSTYPEVWAGSLDGVSMVIQPFHENSIDVDPANGNLLVSARDMDSIFYIEKSTGKVLWKMGGAKESLDDATYVPVADPFYRQHDARLQPGWSSTCNGGTGQITLFDDETQRVGPARAVVYDVTVGAGGGVGDGGCGSGDAAGAKLIWQYAGTSSVSVTGSFRISADGSRVIGWGAETKAEIVFTEVDAEGNDLLDFAFIDGNISYRAIKVPLGAFDLATLRNTAGLQ
jgi:hypothetical protein